MIQAETHAIWAVTFDRLPPDQTRMKVLWYTTYREAREAAAISLGSAALWRRTIETMTATGPWEPVETPGEYPQDGAPQPQ